MYGRETKNSGAKNPQIQPTPSNTTPRVGGGAGSRSQSDAAATLMLPFVLIIAVALYFVWALLEQHQKIKTALEPKAIGINLRNLLQKLFKRRNQVSLIQYNERVSPQQRRVIRPHLS